MSNATEEFSTQGFAKTFVLPALLIFLVPILSLLFFTHVQSHYDETVRKEFLQDIRADKSLTDEQRANAEEFFNTVPVSKMITNEEFADMLTAGGTFDFATFRWAIRLSWWSIIGGIIVFALGGICVVASLRSQQAQYVSLSAGWHVLRLFSAAQVVIQGLLVFALSYWVTAFWFEIYVPKLIALAGLFALVAIGIVIVAIFKKPSNEFVVEGSVIDRNESSQLWQELQSICQKVGTDPPDQLIAGIDDNFFVTEQPVTVGEQTCEGRTLFVSLSLLKQLQGGEADAVLAHEMAHFSGNDTLYSQKINPLLVRYGNYLQGLYEGGLTLPIYYFMNCFRALYELSLGKLSREREFRADRIATDTTSPQHMAGALLRIAAYSNYRSKVQNDLFMKEEVLEVANVSEQIEDGFHQYAADFLSQPDVGNLATSHPFDSHPPLAERLEAVGLPLRSEHSQHALTTPGDAQWFHKIESSESMERDQWSEFEEQFRKYHEETLPYRFLPGNDQQRDIVVRAFPEISFEGKEGLLKLDYECAEFTPWPDPVHYADITGCQLDDSQVLTISLAGKKDCKLKLKKFPDSQQVLEDFQKYYSRYLSAKEYQDYVKQQASEEGDNPD